MADHGEVVVLSVAAVEAEAAAAAVAVVLLAVVPSAAAKAVVVAGADRLEVAGSISPVPVQVARFSGAATLSEVHLQGGLFFLEEVPEALRVAA